MDLKNIRISQNMSAYRLSKLSGVSQSYISEIEAGKKSPTLRVLDKLATVLNVTVSELIEAEVTK